MEQETYIGMDGEELRYLTPEEGDAVMRKRAAAAIPTPEQKRKQMKQNRNRLWLKFFTRIFIVIFSILLVVPMFFMAAISGGIQDGFDDMERNRRRGRRY